MELLVLSGTGQSSGAAGFKGVQGKGVELLVLG